MADAKTEGQRTWLDDVHDAVDEVYRCGDEVSRLADAARELGNDRLADRLRDIQVRLFAAAPQVSRAVNESISDHFKAAQQNTGTILQAVLAGVTIAKRRPEGELPFVTEDEEKTS